MTTRTLSVAPLLLLATACAGTVTGTSVSDKGAPSASIRAAEEVGAAHTPDAAFHLQLAKEQFEHAGMLASKDKAWSDRLLLRAQVDAELALALARSEADKAEALGAIDKVKKLKESATQ